MRTMLEVLRPQKKVFRPILGHVETHFGSVAHPFVACVLLVVINRGS